MLIKYVHNGDVLKECDREYIPREGDSLEMDGDGYIIELVIWVDNVKAPMPFVILKLEKVV